MRYIAFVLNKEYRVEADTHMKARIKAAALFIAEEKLNLKPTHLYNLVRIRKIPEPMALGAYLEEGK